MRLSDPGRSVGGLTRRRARPNYRIPSYRILLLSCFVVSVASLQVEDISIAGYPEEDDNLREFIATEELRGLFPNIFNLATNSLIKATATCGQARREEYCKLVEHIMQSRRQPNMLDSPQCDICDANDVRHRHPIEYAIDGTKKFWQSPTLYNGLENDKVNITIDLRQVYQVAYIVIKMGNSPRPGTWVLEKSLDGESWLPWQYHATHDAECMRQFGIPATTGVPRFTSDDEVICTSEYSKLQPLEAGEIHISLVNGRPGVEKPSESLQNFTRARFVRMRLLNVRTLNADLMIINQRSHHLDRSVTMRYYYSISDISIGGQCICYGHAESCPPDPITGQFKCECRHNTCGESCNKCCPLFNQLPWKQGTNQQPNICQQCQCFNHADRCEYDEEVALNNWSVTPEGVYEGGGRCVECRHNTAGVNCEKCAEGFYRPSGISHYREDACRACDCDAVGSQHTSCIRDDQSARDGLHPGDCVCKPGFGGRRCERCARGYRNYPKCEPCPCNKHGSVNFDTCEEESCVCKQNVEGIYCDRCKAGTIHLSEDNPLGCQPCFCFGLTTNCTEQPFITGKISANLGWNLTDRFGGADDQPETENGDMLLFNSVQNKNGQLYYWKAPANFTGNMLNSYGGSLHYYVYFVPSAEGGDAVPLPDLVIEGNGVKLEYYSRQDFFPRENMTVTIPMREGGNWYNSETRRPITKDDLMRALADVKLFMVRSMYNLKQLQSSISGLQLDTALLLSKDEVKFNQDNEDVLHPLPVDTRMRGVEVCACPDNYGGKSCESCISGFRRVGNQLHGGQCVKCECEGHSDRCDPWSGACIDCKHNTTGPRCEQCDRGHYGNPSLGGDLGTCRPCACPTAANSHSSECALTQLIISGSAAAGADAYVCTACEQGYEGNKCEICADGYFGDAVNGTCKECECSGNVDLADIGNCDRKTGKCLKCVGHTTGDACEKCEDNHYGSALSHNCKACGCHRVGAKSQQCDGNNGICECKENYIGKHCDRCAEGHGDVDNECPSCECDEMGSIGKDCDDVSGQCTCKQGVFGKRCDQCRPGYYNFTDAGCQFCHCNAHGSKEEGTCDSATGKCACRAHVDGNMCEKCEDGFFNITSGAGCQECKCDKIGAEGVHCDMHSGQCACKPGVSGVKCDACAPNHFGLNKEGCKECPACPAPGQVCDAKTGECVCPPNTVGKMCEACADDAWDYHPLRGCRKCDCSPQGANGTKCDPMNGQCRCKEQYVGLACDHCSHGYFNFPTCEPCDCAVDGTEARECKDGICLCDEKGQCPCKKNSDGLKCDQCKPNTFSLDASNELGCTDCFCFNRTDMCVQSSMVWQQIYAEDRIATFAEPWEYYTKKHNLNILKEFPPRFNSYPTDATPLYWPLHKAMLGDRTGSYNGFLRFKIWNDDNRRGLAGVRPDGQYFRYFPQVVLVGNNRMELEHVPWQISEDGKYKVRLHESEWRSRTAPEQPLTRAQMMIALQSVQGIYIRGTYNYPARGDVISISEISLDVAVAESPAAAATALAPSSALGVEQCTACPPGYAGPSCQNPAPGFCRKRHRDFLNSADDMALIGWSEPCACNGHSTTCDAETCLCMDCQHNTQGDWCERCKPGYIGEAENGGPASCTKCACPSVEQSFSDTCKAASSGRGYVCDACKHGYGGEYCEICLTGYYGNPQVPGGECKPCECHRDGSLHGACDPINGQCECRPGVTGRDCSRCQERHAFIGGVCTSCDQGCYLPLMSTLDLIDENLALQNFSSLRPIPWKRLNRIQNDTTFLSTFVSGLVLPSGELTDAEGKTLDIVQGGQFTREADTVIDEARFDAERVNKSAHSILALTNKTELALAEIQKQFREAHNTTQFLAHYAKHGGEKGIHAEMLDVWRAEAEAHYNATVERGAYIDKRFDRAEDEHKHVEELLKRVLTNKLNESSFDNLNERIGEFVQWLEDYRETLHLGAKKDIGDAVKMSELVTKRIDRYKDVAAQLDSMRGDAQDSLAAATDAIEQTRKKALLGMFDDYRSLNESFAELRKGAEECEEMTDKYAQLNDEYDEKFVDPATAHSHKLEADAARITVAFAATKLSAATPIAAAAAYEEIQGALKNASLAAGEAEKAAAEALKESDAKIDGTLPAQVVKSLESSGSLSEDAKTLAEEWAESELPKENKDAEDLLAKGRSAITAATNSKNALKDEWTKFDDYHDRVVGLRETSVTADDRSSNARKQGQKLAEKAGDIEKRADKLLNSTGSGIRDEIVKMKEVRASLSAKMSMAAKQLGGDGETTEEREKRLASFKDKIAMLKDRLGEAREKAEQIRIALHGSETGKCRRNFLSPSTPSPSTSIQIRFRPLRAVPDSLLLLTKTTAKRTVPSEYVALEVVAQRVVAHWNIGAGQKKVTNSYPINYIPSSADRNTWYTVNLKRSGNAVNLTVSLREGAAGTPPPVTVTLPKGDDDGEDVIFNTVPGDTQISIGAEPAVVSGLGLATNEFRGTIGTVSIDGVPMSLWTFSYTTKECGGETAPSRPAVRGHMFRNGFASMRTLVPQERTTTSITVTFAAFSPNGLLYFRGSQSAGDFVTVYLKEGKVVFTINLGSGTSSTIESMKTYDDGLQHTVKAVRGPDGVYLQVDSDEDRQQSFLSGGEATALNIDHDEHFVGGVPAEFERTAFESFDISWKGFFGCILSVKPNQVTELDIENAHRSYRKEPGCMFSAPSSSSSSEKLVPSDRIVGFGKPGFLITQGVTIDGNTNFGFGFRTKEENGTLLFQSSKLAAFRRKQKRDDAANGQGYMAFYLFRGYLVCHFGKDASRRDGVVTIRSTSPFNDGLMHSVFFERSGKRVRVRVDDREIGAEEMLDDSSIGRSGVQLFVGGFPERTKPPNDEIPTALPLVGCVSDLSLNFRPLQMVPEDHEATLGGCPMQAAPISSTGEEGIAHPEVDTANFARTASKLELVMEKNVAVEDVDELYYEVEKEKAAKEKPKPVSEQCGGGFATAHFDGEEGDALRYGIGQSTHGRINFLDKEHYPNITGFTLSFSFRTESADGLLWVWANYKSFSRYFLMHVNDGLLQLDVKGHREPKSVILNERRVDDGQWHDVKIIREERVINIELDGVLSGSMGDAPAPKVMRKRMFMGGVISRHRKTLPTLPVGFNGCIRSIAVNGVSQRFDETTSKDLVPCAPATTKALYAHDGGYASFDASKTRQGIYPSEELSVQLDFRNMQQDGLVFAVLSGNSLEEKRLTAIMKGGQIYMTLVYKSEGIDLRDVPIEREEGELCNGKWHRIAVSVEATRLVVAIDEQSSEIPLVISAAARKSLAGLSLYVGGPSSEVANELSVFSLVGCYSDLRFGEKTLYFEEASKINRGIVDGCPFGRETSAFLR